MSHNLNLRGSCCAIIHLSHLLVKIVFFVGMQDGGDVMIGHHGRSVHESYPAVKGDSHLSSCFIITYLEMISQSNQSNSWAIILHLPSLFC